MRSFLSFVTVLLVACSGARPSRWEPREPSTEPKTACTCDGVERPPRPHEASSDGDPNIVTAVCEGKVRDCRPLRGGGPHGLD